MKIRLYRPNFDWNPGYYILSENNESLGSFDDVGTVKELMGPGFHQPKRGSSIEIELTAKVVKKGKK